MILAILLARLVHAYEKEREKLRAEPPEGQSPRVPFGFSADS